MNKNHGLPGPTREISTDRISAQIFGNLRVRNGSTVLDAHHLGGPKPRQILEILLLRLGTSVSKATLIELLWGGAAPPEAVAALESHISVLRRHLQPGAGKGGALRTVNGGYLIDREHVDVDLDRFDVLYRQARLARPEEALPLLRRALEIAHSPLFGDELTAAWAVNERAAHQAIVNAATSRAAETALAVGKFHEAVSWSRQALELDAMNERSWTTLVLALEQAGRHADALNAYARCRRIMEHELGCPPGPALRAAHLRVLRASVDTDNGLSDVLAALLSLQNHLALSPELSLVEATSVHLTRARSAVDSFLRREVGAA